MKYDYVDTSSKKNKVNFFLKNKNQVNSLTKSNYEINNNIQIITIQAVRLFSTRKKKWHEWKLKKKSKKPFIW